MQEPQDFGTEFLRHVLRQSPFDTFKRDATAEDGLVLQDVSPTGNRRSNKNIRINGRCYMVKPNDHMINVKRPHVHSLSPYQKPPRHQGPRQSNDGYDPKPNVDEADHNIDGTPARRGDMHPLHHLGKGHLAPVDAQSPPDPRLHKRQQTTDSPADGQAHSPKYSVVHVFDLDACFLRARASNRRPLMNPHGKSKIPQNVIILIRRTRFSTSFQVRVGKVRAH